MSLQKNNKALDHCLRYGAIRQCSTDIEKDVILVLNFKSKYNLSIKSICQNFKICHLTLHHAVWSYLNGSPIGKVGSERLTNPDEERELCNYIIKK